jgi:prepilin-type N-terminal cleavage/methylation domain-containing protein
MKIIKRLKNNNGLTLVELLVALSLVSIVLAVALMISLMGLRTFRMDINQSDVQHEVRRTSAKINEVLRNAIAIETSTSTSGADINVESELNNLDSTCTITVVDNILTLHIWAKKDSITNNTVSYELTTDILLNNHEIINITCPSIDVKGIYYELPGEDDFKPTTP